MTSDNNIFSEFITYFNVFSRILRFRKIRVF